MLRPYDYGINVQNHSGESQSYYVWPATPFINPEPATKIYHCVQQASPKVPYPKGSVLFSLNMKHFAVTGPFPKSLEKGMKIELSDFKPLQVCGLDEYGDTLTMSAVHGWSSFTEPKQGCETLSSFSIGTEEGLKEDEADKVFIGLGAADPEIRGRSIPVAFFATQPANNTVFTPLAKYYIAAGTEKPGRLFDPAEVRSPLLVDFISHDATRAWVVHEKHGTWDVSYS
ncbi:hypothetical protein MMC21_006610 [Puttea exsequens]|nr:hypothetical protein [Puttea exsequens]